MGAFEVGVSVLPHELEDGLFEVVVLLHLLNHFVVLLVVED